MSFRQTTQDEVRQILGKASNKAREHDLIICFGLFSKQIVDICHHGFMYHIYADDIQEYIIFKTHENLNN